ncbi:MAG: CxxxxCH/CxxCH domain-containing protein [Leptospirales bacterium]
MQKYKYLQENFSHTSMALFAIIFLMATLFTRSCANLRISPSASSSSCNLTCHSSTIINGEYPESDPKHVQHVKNMKLECGLCHNSYEDNELHKNGFLNNSKTSNNVVFFDYTDNPTIAWDMPSTSCSNSTCHSDANWYDPNPSAGCNFCHKPGNVFPNAPDPLLTGSHTGHSDKSCLDCHSGYISDPNHADAGLDTPVSAPAMINFITANNPTAAYAGGTCSDVSCHGNFSGGNSAAATWGGVVNCTSSSCHGDAGGTGNPADSTPPDTKHGTHVDMLLTVVNPSTGLNYTESESCTVCHDGHGTGTSTHADGKIDITFNYTGGSPGSATGGAFNSGTGQYNAVNCSNTYCHGNFAEGNSDTVSSTESTLDGGWCGSCHTVNVTSVKHSEHLSKYPGQCGNCHQGYTTSSAPVNHVNFAKDVNFGYTHPLNTAGLPSFDSFTKTCSNVYCHGNFPTVTLNGTPNTITGNGYNPTWLSSSTSPCGACHGNPANNYSSPTHGHHTATSSPYFNDATRIESCDACHNYGADSVHTFGSTSTQGSYNTSNHANLSISDSGVNADVSFKAPDTSGSLATVTGDISYSVPRVSGEMTTWTPGSTSCSNSWCHGNFEGSVTGLNSSPDWLDNTTAQCGDCHTNAPPATDSHPKHLSAPYSYTCETCHGSTTGHVNGNIGGADNLVSFNANNPNGSFNIGTKQCSNLYCHGNTSGAGDWNSFTHNTSANNNDPIWTVAQGGGPGSVSCGDCHDATSVSLTTGAHQRHIGNNGTTTYDFPCRRCHSDTFSGDTATLDTGHVDNSLTVVPDSNNPSAVYNYGNHTCSSAYCHGNFTGGNLANVSDWDNTTGGACGDCHDLSPTNSNFGSHDVHTNTNGTGGYNYSCQTCHSGIASGAEGGAITLNIASHVNFSRDIIFNSIADQGPQTVATYNTVSHTCANTYCHGDFASSGNTAQPEGNTTNLPVWGSTAACGTCHGETTGANAGLGIPNNATKWHASGESHYKHAGNAAGNGYRYPCGFCHQGTYDATLSTGNGTGGSYESGLKIPSFALHVNGVRDFNFYTTFTGASSTRTPGAYQEGSCNNMYCHSDGWDLTGSLTDIGGLSSPIWGGASKSVLSCTSCHNNGGVNRAPLHNTTGSKDHYTGNTHENGCVHCHNYTTTSSNIDDLVSDTINYANYRHVNRWKNITFGTADVTTASNGLINYNRTDGTCSLKCHNHNHAAKSGWYDLDSGGIFGGQWIYEP